MAKDLEDWSVKRDYSISSFVWDTPFLQKGFTATDPQGREHHVTAPLWTSDDDAIKGIGEQISRGEI